MPVDLVREIHRAPPSGITRTGASASNSTPAIAMMPTDLGERPADLADACRALLAAAEQALAAPDSLSDDGRAVGPELISRLRDAIAFGEPDALLAAGDPAAAWLRCSTIRRPPVPTLGGREVARYIQLAHPPRGARPASAEGLHRSAAPRPA